MFVSNKALIWRIDVTLKILKLAFVWRNMNTNLYYWNFKVLPNLRHARSWLKDRIFWDCQIFGLVVLH